MDSQTKLRCMYYLMKNKVKVRNYSFSDLDAVFRAMEEYSKVKQKGIQLTMWAKV